MRVLNTKYSSDGELEAFISEHMIAQHSDILLQIFTGNCEVEFIENLISTIKTLIPHIKIIGSTTSGEILEGSAYSDSTILSFSLFEHTTISTYWAELESDSYQTAKSLIAQFDPHQTPKVAISFVDGLHINGEEYINAFDDYDRDLIVAGGLAGDNAKFINTTVFTQDGIVKSGVVVALLYSEVLEVLTKASFGWENIGKTMTITKAIKNVVYEIDGVDAVDIYAKYLGDNIAEMLPVAGIKFPLIVKRNGLSIPRAIFHKNSDGSLVFAGNLNIGDQVSFGYKSIEAIVDCGNAIYSDIYGYNIESIFVYSCMARKNLFRDAIDEELAPLSSISSVSGFFTYGEFYSDTHSSSHQLLNQTMTILGLSESNMKGVTNNRSKPIALDNKNRDNITLQAFSHLISQTSKELEEINTNLEIKIDEEIKKSIYKDTQMAQQLKLVQMVELIDAIGVQDGYSDMQSIFDKLTEVLSQTLNISRVGVWLYNDDKTAIDCKSIYLLRERCHQHGATIKIEEHSHYFRALDSDKIINISDVYASEYTQEFCENYLEPLNIKSTLDIQIKREGRVVGVICSEQIDSFRTWSKDEIRLSKTIAHSVSLMLEIEERKKIDNLLINKTKEQEVLLTLFDMGLSVLFKWNNDKHWSVKYVSSSINSLIGYTQKEFETGDVTYASCIHKDDLEMVTQEVDDAVESGKEFLQHSPYRILTKRSEIRWVLDYTVITREGGKVVSFMGYIVDITEQRMKSEQLLQQSRQAQMGEMMAMIAHQWRQPLSAISATSASINLKSKLNKLNKEKTIELSDKINEYTQFLSDTIDDFRGFFKPNKSREKTDYAKLIDSVLKIIEASIKTKNIGIIQDIKCQDSLMSYPNELKQVILNLLKNSEDVLVDRSIQDPYIKISTYREGNSLLISISDNGGGVPEDIITKIFDPYFSTKLEKNGTGLGLYMSKTIIEEHCGGKLNVANFKDGVEFIISLPANLASKDE